MRAAVEAGEGDAPGQPVDGRADRTVRPIRRPLHVWRVVVAALGLTCPAGLCAYVDVTAPGEADDTSAVLSDFLDAFDAAPAASDDALGLWGIDAYYDRELLVSDGFGRELRRLVELDLRDPGLAAAVFFQAVAGDGGMAAVPDGAVLIAAND